MPPRSNEGEAVRVIGEFSKQIADLSRNVGELTAQVREQIHTSNNTQTMVQALGQRLNKLEAKAERDAGARGLAAAFLQSPLLAWIFAGAVMLWAWLTAHGQVPKT